MSTSAKSGDLFGNGQERMMRAGESIIYPRPQFDGAQYPIGRHHAPLAMYPFGFDGIEPRALDRQVADYDAHSVLGLLDGAVVLADPGSYGAADVPGGIVPHQQQGRLAQGGDLLTAPGQEQRRQRADGLALSEAQPDLLRALGLSCQQAITGQRLGVGVIVSDRQFLQPQRCIGLRPAMTVGLRGSAPPRLVLEAQHPVGVSRRQAD